MVGIMKNTTNKNTKIYCSSTAGTNIHRTFQEEINE